jgi:hypothetical protein
LDGVITHPKEYVDSKDRRRRRRKLAVRDSIYNNNEKKKYIYIEYKS